MIIAPFIGEQNSAYYPFRLFNIKMVTKILNSRTSTIAFATIIIAASTFVSGLLGMFKMRLLAERFDVAFTLDSYFAAFRIPDLLSATLITGGIIVSFLPLFSQYFKKEEKKAWEFTNNLINIAFFIFLFLCLFIWIFAPILIELIAPGFPEAQKELTVSLTRIMFIGPLLFALSGIFSGILQHFDRFIAYALAPILYNVGIIFGIVFLSRFFEQGIYGAAFGVVLGALLHLLIQIPPALKCGYKYKFSFNLKDIGFKKFSWLMLPRMVSQASSQINLIVITVIASLLAAGSVAVFNFANSLYLFPIAIGGVSFAVAYFPSFSRNLANGEKNKFIENFSIIFKQIVFLMLPISLIAFLLRAQIVRLVLGTGEFGWTETRLTAATLGAFALGMVFASVLPLLVRAFFSLQDTKTPAVATVFSMILNIALSLIFVFLIKESATINSFIASVFKLEGIDDFRVIGLALAVALATMVQFFLLLWLLKKKMNTFPLRNIGCSCSKILIASLIMATAVYFSLRVVVLFVELTTFTAVLFQLIFASLLGLIVYFFVLKLLRSEDLERFVGFFTRQIKYLKKVNE